MESCAQELLCQQQIKTMSVRIETKLGEKERLEIFDALFESGLMGSYYAPYLASGAIINVLQNSFGSFKYKIDPNHLSLQSRTNLNWIKFVLANIPLLKRNMTTPSEHPSSNHIDLESYFRNYQHRYNNNNFHDKNNDTITTTTKIDRNKMNDLMNVLRNLMFQVGIICRIFQIIDDNNERASYIANRVKTGMNDQNIKRGGSSYSKRRIDIHMQKHTTDRDIYQMLQKYLDLQFIDITIHRNDISLYHLFTMQKKVDLMRLLLVYGDGDWSIMKDACGQV